MTRKVFPLAGIPVPDWDRDMPQGTFGDSELAWRQFPQTLFELRSALGEFAEDCNASEVDDAMFHLACGVVRGRRALVV